MKISTFRFLITRPDSQLKLVQIAIYQKLSRLDREQFLTEPHLELA
jgi:hypothetical protein